MVVRQLDELLYDAKIGPTTLVTITQFMSDADKSNYLRRYTNFPRPKIIAVGLIEVPDPAGFSHKVTHHDMGWGDLFTCQLHGTCWGTHSAQREYNLQSGIEYERNTGASIHTLYPGD